MDLYRNVVCSKVCFSFLCNKHLFSLHAKLKGLLYPIDMCVGYITTVEKTFKKKILCLYWIDSFMHAIEQRFFSFTCSPTLFWIFFIQHSLFLCNNIRIFISERYLNKQQQSRLQKVTRLGKSHLFDLIKWCLSSNHWSLYKFKVLLMIYFWNQYLIIKDNVTSGVSIFI